MASLFGNLLSRVVRVKIQGNITHKMTQQIISGINKNKIYKPQAIAIIINSAGGDLGHAKSIANILKQYSERNNAPIYSFAQDFCLGSANILLTTGVKAYSADMSILGDFNFSWNRIWLKKLSDKYNSRIQYLHSGQNKIKFNPFEEIKPQNQKWMQNYLYHLEHQLKMCVTQNREMHFRKKKLQKENLEEQLFKGGAINPEKAIQLGYIDGFKTFDDLMNTTFTGSKIVDLIKKKRKIFAHYN